MKLLAIIPDWTWVHLTLTSEWDNIKFSLTSGASFAHTDGYFIHLYFQKKIIRVNRFKEHGWNLVEIEAEFRAQIELVKNMYQGYLMSPDIWANVVLDSSIQAMTDRITKEYGIDINLQNME